MIEQIAIRPEARPDYDAVRHLHTVAFGGGIEANLVDALSEGGHMAISLVAEWRGRVVAHIGFSPLTIISPQETVGALSLAPVAVLPEFQRQGIGSLLIRTALATAAQASHRMVIVLGEPAYYSRFGFSAELAKPLQSQYAGDYFMALELVPGALNDVQGEVRYAPPFALLE